MKRLLPEYRRSFLISVIIILTISSLILFINNFSVIATNQLFEDTLKNSKKVSEDLLQTQTDVDAYVRVIDGFVTQADILDKTEQLTVLNQQVAALLRRFVLSEQSTNGFFYQLNATEPTLECEVAYDKDKGKVSHISTLLDYTYIRDLNQRFQENPESKWLSIYNAFSNSVYLAYVIPICKDGKYLGFMGVMMDMDYLEGVIQQWDVVDTRYRRTLLLTEDKEVLIHSRSDLGESASWLHGEQYTQLFQNQDDHGRLKVKIDGRTWICAYVTLPSGQIFMEEQNRFRAMGSLNWFIALITLFSVLSMWIVQKGRVSGKSVLDGITEMVMRKREDGLTVMESNSKKAVVALGIGASGVFLSYSVYSLVLGRSLYYTLLYLFIGALSILLPYANVRWSNKGFSYLIVYGMGLSPVLLHLMRGGFGDGNTGMTLSWFLVVILLSQFAMDEVRAKNAIYIFVFIVFSNVLLEFYWLGNFDYERIFVFLTSLLFVGFALVVATRIYLQGAVRDYDAIESLLNEIKESQVQLVQREKMAALGQLIAGVAHEINTPIGAVKASAQTMEAKFVNVSKLMFRCGQEFDDIDYDCFFGLLSMSRRGVAEMKSTLDVKKAEANIRAYFEEIDLPHREEVLDKLIRFEVTDLEAVKENEGLLRNPDICEILDILSVISPFTVGIQTILFATLRVSKILFALKSYSYVDTKDEMAEFDLVKNIEDVLVLYHNQIKQSIRVVREYGDDIPVVRGKQDEMYQVWTNLIQNAIYAMREGGTLTISIKNLRNECVEVGVGDTGVGMPKEVEERIFEPFYTTKPLGEGSGMGLDISRKVVLHHEGSIEVKSEEGKGTLFTVRIPISPQG